MQQNAEAAMSIMNQRVIHIIKNDIDSPIERTLKITPEGLNLLEKPL